jgi:hypothetical protein
MGNEFSIGHSRSKKLKHLNSNSCDDSLAITRTYIKQEIKKLKKITDFQKTDDYKKYKLFPGQQLRRISKNLVPHACIYIYNGIIFEMGSGPKKCSKKLGKMIHIKNNINGLSSLKQFKHNSKKINIIVTNIDNDKKTIMERLKRVLQMVGKNDYNFAFNNCFHMANYISHNSKSLLHVKNLKRKSIK